MKLNEIEFRDLIDLVKDLPESQKTILKSAMNSKLKRKSKTQLQKLLLNGPVMTATEEKSFRRIRKSMNQWRAK